MVFGWGKKKEEKKIDEITDLKHVSIESVPKIIDDVLELRSVQTLKEIKFLRDMTEPLIEELIQIGQTLAQDNLDVDDIDKHLRIIVTRGKKQVIDVIKKDASELPVVSTLDDAENVGTILNQILKKIGDVLGRQTRVIHIFAKKYAEKLKDILAQMNSNHSEIQLLLENYRNTKATSDQILDLLKNITNARHDVKHIQKNIDELKTNSLYLEKEVISLTNSIEQIKQSKEYKEYLMLKQSLNDLNDEYLQIKNQIDSQFTKISRPLSRYEYVSSDKEQRHLLTKLVSDPIDAMTSTNKDLIIIILENIRKGIISGSISVKDLDKSMTQITETVELLDYFINQVVNVNDRIEKIKMQMSNFDNSLIAPEQILEKTLRDKGDAAHKISMFENDMKQIQLQLTDFLSQLESKLRQLTNIRYTVKESP